MKRITLILMLFFTLIFLMEQCKHESTDKLNTILIDTTHLPIDTSNHHVTDTNSQHNGHNTGDSVCYNTQIYPLIHSTCAMSGCHDPYSKRKGYDLSTYSLIAKNTGAINYVVVNNKMPQNIPLWTTAQKQLFQKWMSEGAKDVECEITNCDTTNVLYSTHIQPVLATNCVGCHSSSNAGGGIVLDNYTSAKTSGLSGHLLCSVEWTNACKNMPQNSPKLQYCDRRKLAIWVLNNCPQ